MKTNCHHNLQLYDYQCFCFRNANCGRGLENWGFFWRNHCKSWKLVVDAMCQFEGERQWWLFWEGWLLEITTCHGYGCKDCYQGVVLLGTAMLIEILDDLFCFKEWWLILGGHEHWCWERSIRWLSNKYIMIHHFILSNGYFHINIISELIIVSKLYIQNDLMCDSFKFSHHNYGFNNYKVR